MMKTNSFCTLLFDTSNMFAIVLDNNRKNTTNCHTQREYRCTSFGYMLFLLYETN
jgi:hypothetical protein